MGKDLEDDENQMQKKVKKPYREEYGELDRPDPSDVISEIKDRFVDWDVYKMSVM